MVGHGSAEALVAKLMLEALSLEDFVTEAEPEKQTWDREAWCGGFAGVRAVVAGAVGRWRLGGWGLGGWRLAEGAATMDLAGGGGVEADGAE